MLHEESNTIISELYDLVASPDQYDDFMVQLQTKLEILRSDGRSGEAGTILAHMSRAASLVDIVTPWRRETDANLHKAIAQRMQATLALDEAGNIIDANSAAKVVFDLVPDCHVSVLPIELEELQRLNRRIRQVVLQPEAQNHPNDVLRLHNMQSGQPLLVRLESYTQESTKRRFAILRTSDIGWPSHLGPILQDLFDLSRAEIDVVRLMVGRAQSQRDCTASARIDHHNTQPASVCFCQDRHQESDGLRSHCVRPVPFA